MTSVRTVSEVAPPALLSCATARSTSASVASADSVPIQVPPGARTRSRVSFALLGVTRGAVGLGASPGAAAPGRGCPDRSAFSRADFSARARLSSSICWRTRALASICTVSRATLR